MAAGERCHRLRTVVLERRVRGPPYVTTVGSGTSDARPGARSGTVNRGSDQELCRRSFRSGNVRSWSVLPRRRVSETSPGLKTYLRLTKGNYAKMNVGNSRELSGTFTSPNKYWGRERTTTHRGCVSTNKNRSSQKPLQTSCCNSTL